MAIATATDVTTLEAVQTLHSSLAASSADAASLASSTISWLTAWRDEPKLQRRQEGRRGTELGPVNLPRTVTCLVSPMWFMMILIVMAK